MTITDLRKTGLGRWEIPDEAVGHVAKQVKVAASELASYEWSGSTIEYHRGQIRAHLGFRTCTTADAAKLGVWLAENVAHAERRHAGTGHQSWRLKGAPFRLEWIPVLHP
ncbi:DUF4158 domain-containing protein [Acrocarpospora sp. B8E8]|uniref:DUF4158 domain-containing protein n=1 Tax=Acrocarpospora sp. B8E8 TaxID=3153572 RepID=UPI00325EDF18